MLLSSGVVPGDSMTEATAAVRGLPHAVFLRPLAGEAPGLLEGRLGQAAFLVLRIVDWLAADRPPIHPDSFHYQHAATERLCRALPLDSTEAGRLKEILAGARDAFPMQEPRPGAPALIAFAHYLEDELRRAPTP